MADKTITVSLDFIANTNQAEASLQKLSTNLRDISNLQVATPNGTITKDILKASDAAIQLRKNLQLAYDQKTGKLDLSKFSTQLKTSNQSIRSLARDLSAIGPQGQQAFRELATAIISSETPLKQTNLLVNKLWDGLKRTMGWQMSSTMIHGFMGAIQSAYGYAQDLNQSLNNIRIVTGASTDEMARFAEKANKAAKALSSTTTDYTDAALIYYQQGIRDESEIAERTDTTIKLANVSRQSAEEVSSQMTAIWNNFADGSHNLEYYADVITKLGATTAASSSEIAGGMEKFAAVADTVGLSYEYAAASLATIVATTRQSEDTVGTGLRTIFSRLEGLKLGDTLEDGTDLNKYSQALATVGVNIKDASGNLKDMDTILDETAAKWDSLNQAQKVAFATTVGGVRQYTNLIALLDNWNMMEENIATARGSEGTLQEQQDIYAESWEAAQKRVRAAAESIYSDLLDDDFFIKLTSGFGKFLEILDTVIDNIGGLKTLLPGLILLMNGLFGDKIQVGISKIAYNLVGLTKAGREARLAKDQAVKEETLDVLRENNAKSITGSVGSQENKNMAAIYEKITNLQSKMIDKADTLTEQEKLLYQASIERLEVLAKTSGEIGKEYDLTRQLTSEQEKQVESAMTTVSKRTMKVHNWKESTWEQKQAENPTLADAITTNKRGDLQGALEEVNQYREQILGVKEPIDATKISIQDFREELAKMVSAMSTMSTKDVSVFSQLAEDLAYGEIQAQNFTKALTQAEIIDEATQDFQEFEEGATLSAEQLNAIQEALSSIDFSMLSEEQQNTAKKALELTKNFSNEKKEIDELTSALKNLMEAQQEYNNSTSQKKTEARENIVKKIKGNKKQRQQAEEKLDDIEDGRQQTAEKKEEGRQQDRTAQNIPKIKEPPITAYDNFAKTVQSVAGAAMQAQMAISTLSNAWSTITNPDTTGMEKFLAGLSALGMGIPALVGMFNNLTKVMTSYNTISELAAAVTTAYNASQEKGLGTLLKIIAQKIFKIGVTETETVATGAAAVAEGADAVAEGAAATETTAHGLANIFLEGTFGPLILVVLAFVAAIAAIVAIGAGVVAIINAISDSMHATEIAAQEANASVKEMTTAYEDAKNAAQEFKDTISDYDEAQKALDQMDHNTREYAEALEEANEKTRELIESQGLWGAAKYDNETGRLTIDKESDAYKNRQTELEAQQHSARNNLISAERYADQKNLDLEAQQLSKKAKVSVVDYDVNAPDGITTRNLNRNELSTAARFMQEASKQVDIKDADALKNFDGFKDLPPVIQNNIEALSKVSDELLKFGNSLDDAAAKADYYDQEALRNTVDEQYGEAHRERATNDDGTVNEDKANAMTNATAALAAKNDASYTKKLDEYQKNISDISSTSNLNNYLEDTLGADMSLYEKNGARDVHNDEELAKTYAAMKFGADRNSLTYDGGNGVGSITDAEGNQLFSEVSDEVMRREIAKMAAAEKASEDIAGSVADPEQFVQELTTTGEEAGAKFGTDFSTAMLNSIASGDGGAIDMSSIIGDLDEEGLANLQEQFNNMSGAEVANTLGISDEDAKQAGYENAAAYGEAFKEGIQNIDMEAVVASEMDKIRSKGTEAGFDADEVQAYTESLKQLYPNLANNTKAAGDMAIAMMKADRGFQSLSKNFADYKKSLDVSKKGTAEWSKALTSFSKDLSDILGSDITREFAQNIAEDTEMMSLLERGINGDKEAMAQFQAQVATKTILGVDFDTDGIDAKEQHVLDIINELTSQDVEIGASLDTTGMTDSFNELIAAGQATSQQISDALAQAGYSPQITYKEISIDDAAAMSQTGYVEVVDDVGPPPHTSMVAIDSLSDVASNNMVKVPVIDGKGTTYTGGAKSAAGAGSKGGGGGGGGGGGSQKKKEAPKADRGARYHGINRRQSNNSRQQTENNRRKDRAFGKAAVELAREDLEIQKKKIELQEEYTKEISKNLKDDREEMKKQFEALQLPINFKFDEDGEISNYQEIIDALFEKEKALVNQYNSGGLDDEAFDEAKKKLDEAKEALGNYEETLEKQKDELQTLSEYMEELSDKALELTQIKFELNMSIIEDQLEWLDYSLSEIEDDAYSAAKAIALMGEQTSQYLKQGDVARAAISEILGRHGVNSIEELNGLSDSQIEALGFNKDEIDALKDYRSQLYESNQALLEMRRTITDKVLDTFDTFNEKVSESYEEFDKYNDVLESYNNIVDLLGTKTDAATRRLVKNIRDTQLQNLRNQSVSAKEIYEGALANYNLAEKQYNDAVARYGVNSIEAQQMEEIMKQAADARDEAYSSWLDAYQASLEKAREIYEAEMEELQKDFERSLTGIYGTFDLFDAAYERAKELKDNYLPEYEKIYELNKLNRDIQKEIDNSSSLRDKKALRQLQDEINRKQEAGVQLSKYEVEEMRKKFELEQARMNLEDARNNKSEVRLTRDQNGNWGYVYTASEDKVADAEQKYEDALYQYQKLSDDYITDLDEKIKDLTKNTQERLDEVREALEEGLIDIDQAEQQKQDILNSFYTQQSYLVSQFKGATDSLASSLGLMDELYGQQAELVDTLPETTFGQVSSVGSMEEWAAKSSEGILKYAEESAKAYERLQTTNQEIADQNKLNLSDIETATNNVAKSSEETQQKVSETVQALADSFKSTMGALATWDQTYAATIQSAIAQNDLFITSLNNVIAKLGLIATYEMKDLYDYIDYLSAKGAKGETITEAEWKKLDEIRQKYAANYSKESMAPFDTGGYTGEWGDEGKIAILHEKEYVLNADLTARFFDALKTFSLVDQFVNTENQIQQQQLQIETLEALSNYIDQLADRMNTTTINPNDFSASLFNSGNQQLEQNVHIEANFPNVTQSSEIEMAFDNLVNKASQYINRKNMSSMTFQDSYLSPV